MIEPKMEQTAVQTVSWNFPAVREALAAEVEKYKGLLVTAENVEDMERARREVVRYRTAIQRFKKKGREMYRRPMDEFTMHCDDLLQLVEAVERPLSIQLAAYEDRRVAAMENRCRVYFENECQNRGVEETYRGGFAILNKWTNKTQKWVDTMQDIDAQVEACLAVQETDKARQELWGLRWESLEAYAEKKSRDAGLTAPITLSSTPEKLERLELACGKARIDEMIARQAEKEARMKAAETPAPESAPEKQAFEPFTVTIRFTIRSEGDGRLLNEALQSLGGMRIDVVDEGGNER